MVKHFIGYKNYDYLTKPLPIMLPKMRAYVKTYDGESRWMTFLIKDNLIKYDIGIKSVKVLKKNLNENPSSIIFFWKTK